MNGNNLLNSLLNSGAAGGFAGGLAGGALTSALTSKKGRKAATKMLKFGGVAALGGLAYKAYQGYREQQPGAATPSNFPDVAADEFAIADSGSQDIGVDPMLLVRAMITAAMADGTLDAGEQERIFGRIDTLALSAQDRADLMMELRHPRSMEDIVRETSSPAAAIEVYAASLLALDVNAEGSAAYLDRLRTALRLPSALTHQVANQAFTLNDESHRAA